MNRCRRLVAVAIVGSLTTMSAPTPGAARTGGAELSGPGIDHVVVIIEQNHTFDSYFGTYPGVDGLPAGDVVPPDDPAGGGVVTGGVAGGGVELSNGRTAALSAHRAGAMDNFVGAQEELGYDGELSLMVHDRTTAPILWSLADEFVLFDHFFSSAFGGSLPNTLHLMTGDGHGITEDSKASLAALQELSPPTVFDRLQDAGEDWNLYVGRLDEIDPETVISGGYRRPSTVTPSALYWAPALAMPRFWTDPELRAGLADQEAFYRDAAAGALPAVSFIVPQPTDHPSGSGIQGQERLQSLVNAIIKSPDWDHTAVFVVWDDWGGFRDHVPPPTGLGFRVPMLMLSPYARPGFVSSVEHDHTSVLDFIVDRFDLEPLSSRQRASLPFDDALLAEPRADRRLITNVELDATPVGTRHQNRLTLALYLVASSLAVGVLVVILRRRPMTTAIAVRPAKTPGGL